VDGCCESAGGAIQISTNRLTPAVRPMREAHPLPNNTEPPGQSPYPTKMPAPGI
jgi:hypothetical protein